MTARLTRARLGRILFDITIAVLVAGLTILMAAQHLPRVLFLLGAGMAVAVLFRRRWPLTVMGVIAALALVQSLLTRSGQQPLPMDAAVVIAMYSVVKYGRPLWHAYLAAAVVLVGIVIEVARHSSPTWWAQAALYVAGCASAWLAGYTVRIRRLYVAQLEERAATAERERDHLSRLAMADERAGIARELHDIVAHSLAVMIVQADGARYAMAQHPEAARVAIQQVATTGRESLTEMHRLVGLLRGDAPVDDHAGPDGSTGDRRRLGVQALDGLVERAGSAGLSATLACTGARPDLPAGLDLAVYRIVQEALTNVLRHAGGGPTVTVAVAYSPRAVSVTITDDGGSRPWPRPPHSLGHGLIGMKERVAVYGGTFEAGPDGPGWRVAATLPWTPPPEAPSDVAEPDGRTDPPGAAEPAGRTDPLGAAEPAGRTDPLGAAEPAGAPPAAGGGAAAASRVVS